MRDRLLYPPANPDTTRKAWADVARAAARHRSVKGGDAVGASSIGRTPAIALAYHRLKVAIAHGLGAHVLEDEILDALQSGDGHTYTRAQALSIIRAARQITGP